MTMLSWWSTLLFLSRSQLTSWCRFFIVTSCTRIGWLCADYLQVFISSISECVVYIIMTLSPYIVESSSLSSSGTLFLLLLSHRLDWRGSEGGEKETIPHKTIDSLFHCQIATVSANILENHLHILQSQYCSISSNFHLKTFWLKWKCILLLLAAC